MSQSDAKRVFDARIASIGDRTAAIASLLGANGIALSPDRASLQVANDWFVANVERDPSSPDRLRPLWYSVVNDLSLFLSEVILSGAPNLRWRFVDRPPSDLAFQRHVLSGFTRVPNPRYYVDIDDMLAAYGLRATKDRGLDREAFVRWVEDAIRKA
jgi:hypothetical protein